MRSPSPLAGQLVSLCRSCLGAILLLFHRYSFPVVHRRHRLTEDILALCLDLSTPSTLKFPESLVTRFLCVDVSAGGGHLPNSCPPQFGASHSFP